MSIPKYADLGDMNDDQRIAIIGDSVMRLGKTVAFIVDADPGKAERYISKLKSKFPGILVISQFAGPIKGTVSVKVGPPSPANN